ncbi:hypothetical protein JJB09_18865 [Rhizobium sp. KVB221]|uniref:Uncharacterized protein n=1 Tax=Rhizobium setariae TaxID=2801340 RepID=A0A936YR03_9HYPH|nr:hypothetical protein [Rhizobium setariae]MBL0374088.1 hypothetical protein [Rhizobium setariae]
MFMRTGILLALATLVMFPVGIDTADAGQRHNRYHHHVRHNHKLFRQRVAHHRGPRNVIKSKVVVNVINGSGYGYVTQSSGTYSGDVSVSYQPGVGTWSYGTTSRISNPRIRAGGAKIINVGHRNNDCRMEMGVCVIRP